jgi:tetratricopeptide (TPR) repeat protein
MLARTLYSLGAIKVAEGEEDFARELFSKALVYEPGQLESLYGLGYCCAKNCSNEAGDCEMALRLMDSVIKYHPLYRKAFYNRGVVEEYLHQYNKALFDYSCAIFLNNRDADFYFARGNTLKKIGKNQEALNDYREADCLGHNRAAEQIEKIQQEIDQENEHK